MFRTQALFTIYAWHGKIRPSSIWFGLTGLWYDFFFFDNFYWRYIVQVESGMIRIRELKCFLDPDPRLLLLFTSINSHLKVWIFASKNKRKHSVVKWIEFLSYWGLGKLSSHLLWNQISLFKTALVMINT